MIGILFGVTALGYMIIFTRNGYLEMRGGRIQGMLVLIIIFSFLVVSFLSFLSAKKGIKILKSMDFFQ